MDRQHTRRGQYSPTRHSRPRLNRQEIVGIAPRVYTVSGDIGIFAKGLHVPTVPIEGQGIMQLPQYQNIRSQDCSSTSMPYLPKALRGHMLKKYKGLLTLLRSETLYHGMPQACPQLSPVQTRPLHSIDTTVWDFTITLSISRTSLYHLMLQKYMCLHRPDFLIRFKIKNLNSVLKHDYFWKRVISSGVSVVHQSHVLFCFYNITYVVISNIVCQETQLVLRNHDEISKQTIRV